VKVVERFGSGEELEMVCIVQHAIAICRIFQQRKERTREDGRAV